VLRRVLALAPSLAAIFGISARDWKSEKWPSFEKMITPCGEGPKAIFTVHLTGNSHEGPRANNLFLGGFLLSQCGARQSEAKPEGDESFIRCIFPR
jgi:hypothetical protein